MYPITNPVFPMQLKLQSLRLIAALLFLLVCVSATHAQSNVQSDTHSDTQSFDKGLLYKIEKKGFQESYILGTIHSGDPRVLDISGEVRRSLLKSDQFIMEIKFEPSGLMHSMSNMWLLDGRKLHEVIGDELYASVIETGASLGMPEQAFEVMKPWVVMMLFSLPPGNYDQILDIELMKLAATNGMSVKGLETVQEQFDVIDKMSEADQVSLLEETLKNFPNLSQQFESLFDAYLAKDLGRLSKLSEEQMVDSGDGAMDRLMQRMVDDRNNKMFDRLLPLMRAENSFIAVGALHLPGESGLLTRFSEAGFSVTVIE